ncbi:MAG: hypothetical protein AAF702_01575 [Chloroflexota bacterium]
MSKDTEIAGLVVTRKNKLHREQKVSLYRASEAGLCTDGGEWVTVCEEHGTLCNHRTRRLAESHLVSAGWCEACMG